MICPGSVNAAADAWGDDSVVVDSGVELVADLDHYRLVGTKIGALLKGCGFSISGLCSVMLRG
jgi:hypothetical protein